MATEGQEVTQPALQQALPEVLNHAQAVEAVSQMIKAAEKKPQARDQMTGKFVDKETPTAEAKTGEVTPEKETPEVEAEATPAEAETVEATPTRKLKLNYKGEEREVEETEAIELAQKGFDYTQKTQALAKEREELQAKIKTESETARKQYETQLETYRQSILAVADPDVVGADLAKVADTDPARALKLNLQRQQLFEKLGAIQQEQERLAKVRTEEAQVAYKKQAQEAVEKLQIEIPGWNHELYGKILKTAQSDYGMKAEEVNSITDHRAIKVLHDAMKYRESLAAKPKLVEKRVANVPKVQKPGTTEKPNAAANKEREVMDRLTKTGSRNDAVELVTRMFQSGRL